MAPDPIDVNGQLEAALAEVAAAFRGMTAHQLESNCECHWGSAEELALLKTPDVPLDDDLLQRTYWLGDWIYHGPLLRRIMPQVTRGLVTGQVEPIGGLERNFIRGRWQEWPAAQRDAVRAFLDAWWLHVLVAPGAKVTAHEALQFLAEVSVQVTPWLTTWESLLTNPTAARRLAVAVDDWMYDLSDDALPWRSEHDGTDWCPTLSLWVLRHAPRVLREQDASAERQDDVRRLALPLDARWDT
ncbi:hypothetical protein [Micromonospora lupini]|uniref:Uncharacterized protein n=1 Tax=Micromonospora lupini str. Lupac 08 TaxID=1150864 RepID=I0L6F0_9ACTN|nr:hypothetical protein [Micromonospora lupini]CCH19397.1 Conserved hypothetical protein [Micromonospora lupini str. Lupac 08]